MTIDVGTGDGRAVLGAAARDPATLVLGLDANAAGMAEASRRAAGPTRKGGLPNAAFLVAAAERPPPALCSLAQTVTVRLPWGSLRRGILGGDPAIAAGVANLVAPGGVLDLLLAPSPRDGLGDWPTNATELEHRVVAAFAPHNLRLMEARPAAPADVAASGSTWAKRLLAAGGGDRWALVVRLARSVEGEPAARRG